MAGFYNRILAGFPSFLKWDSIPLYVCVRAQSCLTLCDPMDYSPPGSSVHGILQARTLEWIAVSSSSGSSQPRDQGCILCVPCIASGFFPTEPPGKPIALYIYTVLFLSIFCHQMLGLFPCLGYCNNGAMDTGVHVSLWDIDFISFFIYITQETHAKSYCSSTFNHHTIFYSDCTNLHSHQQCTRIPFSLHTCHIVILTGMKRYLLVVLPFISVMINDIEHLIR